jgi:D-alanyl-D-alanine carboxypeptidase
MNPRRMAVEMWPTLVFGGGLTVLVGCIGSAGSAGAVRVVDRLAPSLAANTKAVTVPPRMAATGPAISNDDIATAAELLAEVAVDPVAREKQATEKQQTVVVAALSDPAEVLPQETAVQAAASAAASVADPPPREAAAANRLEIIGECLVAEACIDQFLWALYERTPKLDTIKEIERYTVKVRKKGKLRTVTRTTTRLVNNDFTWKDPKAAERAGMSMIDYVIGGMEKSFKLKLFYMLQAAENAGLSPGITSAFRDDYRQSIASGLKAASDRSYHGGSTRGGYGHGLAADIVSTKGATRSQRWVSTEALWKWVDTNGKDFGIGRPYLDHDPPHVGPMDGQEYVSKRGAPKAADAKKRDKQAAQEKPTSAKRPHVAKSSSKGRTT